MVSSPDVVEDLAELQICLLLVCVRGQDVLERGVRTFQRRGALGLLSQGGTPEQAWVRQAGGSAVQHGKRGARVCHGTVRLRGEGQRASGQSMRDEATCSQALHRHEGVRRPATGAFRSRTGSSCARTSSAPSPTRRSGASPGESSTARTALTRAGIEARWHQPVVEAVRHGAPVFAQLYDGSSVGPARQLDSALDTLGVDRDDDEAVQSVNHEWHAVRLARTAL